MIELKNHPNPYKLNCKFYAQPDFPPIVSYKGRDYCLTGKVGVVFKTGVPSAEYSFVDKDWESFDTFNFSEYRIWLDANNNITEE